MRRLILAVMIVLLPLRGWIGDAMALEAATGTGFKDEIMRLVRQKADAGEVRSVEKADAPSAHADADAEVIDLTELLKRSLQGGGKAPAKARPGRQRACRAGRQRHLGRWSGLHRVPGLPYRGHERGCGAIASVAPAGPRAGNAVSPLHQRPASARPEATHFLTSLPVVRLPSGV